MRRVVIGQRNAGEYGAWVSRPGKDVFSTEASDFLISPAFNLGQPFLVGSLFTASTSGINTVVAHNLGYRPVVAVFGNQNTHEPVYSVDNTNLYLSGNKIPTYFLPINVTYVIFRNRNL